MIRLFLFTFCFVLLSSFAPAQQEKKITISGYTYNSNSRIPVPYVQIASYSQITVFSSDSSGYFTLNVPANDSLKMVCMGYKPTIIYVDTLMQTNHTDTIFLKPHSYLLSEVEVRARKKESLLDPHFFPEFEDDTPKIRMHIPNKIELSFDSYDKADPLLPQIELGLSPITMIYNRFSRQGKNLRKLKKEKEEQNTRKLWSKIVSSYTFEHWVASEVDNLDEFKVFCNTHIQISENDNELSIHQKVMELLEIYRKKRE